MKKMNISTRFYLLIFMGVLFFTACQKDKEIVDMGPGCEGPECTIEGVVREAGAPETITEVQDSTFLEEEIDFSGNYECKNFEVDITQARGDYRTFDPNSEIIWPGNLLQGNSISNATPNPIVVERAGGEFTINLINGSSSLNTSAKVDEVDQTRVVGALNDILGSNNGLIPANFTYEKYEVQSQEELALKMGVNVKTLTTSVKAKMAFSSEKEYNRILVDFSQLYYTMIYEKPTSLDQVFAPEVTTEDLNPFISNGNPPVYISSVTYGRRLYVLIESTASSTDMEAAISATYNSALVEGSGSTEVNQVKDLAENKIKIFAMGGDASDALAAFEGDFSALKNYLQADEHDYLKAAPLSYVMRDLANHQTVNIGVSTTFTVNQCKPIYDISPPTFVKDWYGIFNNEGIGVALAIDKDQNNAYLFNQAGDKYVLSQNGEIGNTFDLNGSSGPLAGCPFDAIGAAQNAGASSYFFNTTGMEWAILYSTGEWSEPESIHTYGVDGSHPFLTAPVGEPGVGSASIYTNGRTYHFDRRGLRYTLYNSANGGSFGAPSGLEEWGGNLGPQYNIPFLEEGVGAALQLKVDLGFYDGTTGSKDYAQILFSKDGKSFSIYHGGTNRGFTPVYQIAE